MAVIHLGVAGALSTFNCSNYLIICSGEVVKPWHFTFSLAICISGIYQFLYLVNTGKNNSVNPVFQLQSLHCYWFLTLATEPLVFSACKSLWDVSSLKLIYLVMNFLVQRLKRMCQVLVLQANPIKLEVSLLWVPVNGKGEAWPHQARKLSCLWILMFRGHSGNCWVTLQEEL